MTRRDGLATAIAVTTVAMAAWLSGCGLIDSGLFDGGGDALICEGETCTCAVQNDGGQSSCIGACECADGDLFCINEAFACSVIDDDGCFNSACVCTSDTGPESCGCGDEPGTCTGTGETEVTTFDDTIGCFGDCACKVEQGAPFCRCNGACLIQAEGLPCDTDGQCAAISFARQAGCAEFGPNACDGGEICAQIADIQSYCFDDASDGCNGGFTAQVIATNLGDLTVCVGNAPDAARCNGTVCADNF